MFNTVFLDVVAPDEGLFEQIGGGVGVLGICAIVAAVVIVAVAVTLIVKKAKKK